MSPFDRDPIKRHVSGATVVHRSPFSSIEVPQIGDLLSKEEIEKWVVPFYRVNFRNPPAEFVSALRAIYREITPELVERLLTDYNWRPRTVAALFAALKRFEALESHIGKLLLRSDLCFAGATYCIVLAEFNTPAGLDYLQQYADYYLTRSDLDYNQGSALGAIAYLDEKNGTELITSYSPKWDSFVSGRSRKIELQDVVERFKSTMESLHQLHATLEADS